MADFLVKVVYDLVGGRGLSFFSGRPPRLVARFRRKLFGGKINCQLAFDSPEAAVQFHGSLAH